MVEYSRIKGKSNTRFMRFQPYIYSDSKIENEKQEMHYNKSLF